MVPGSRIYALSCGKCDKNCENERGAKATLRPFYKEFGRGRKFGPNDIETGVKKFFWGVLQPKLKASCVSLGSLAVGNML